MAQSIRPSVLVGSISNNPIGSITLVGTKNGANLSLVRKSSNALLLLPLNVSEFGPSNILLGKIGMAEHVKILERSDINIPFIVFSNPSKNSFCVLTSTVPFLSLSQKPSSPSLIFSSTPYILSKRNCIISLMSTPQAANTSIIKSKIDVQVFPCIISRILIGKFSIKVLIAAICPNTLSVGAIC